MSKTSDTPRTDIAKFTIQSAGDVVHAEIARQLERELQVARAARKAIEQRLAAAERDAGRYQWLRSKANRTMLKNKTYAGTVQVIQWTEREAADVLWLEKLDAAIDLALKENVRDE